MVLHCTLESVINKEKHPDATIMARSMRWVAVAPMNMPSSRNAENPAKGMASTQ